MRGRDQDYVAGLQNASLTLAALTIRKPVERALDVGTGFGLQALLAARHAREVVATDVNTRALRLADLNSRLNGAAVETRGGSWFEPVEGDSFDLIVANPPFVISPDNRQLFRDSELGGEGVSRKVTIEAAEHLNAGGHATILANWICRDAGETWEPLRDWVEGSGCDALLLGKRADHSAPVRVAVERVAPLRSRDLRARGGAVARPLRTAGSARDRVWRSRPPAPGG